MLNHVSLAPSSSENLSTASMEIELFEDSEWTGFKFITKKKGPYGPTKEECEDYYQKHKTDVLITITADHGRYSWMARCVDPIFEVLKDGFQTLTIPVTAKYKIELVAPGWYESENIHEYTGPVYAMSASQGVRIIGEFELEKGQKITAALGQQPEFQDIDVDRKRGGSFLVLETDKEPKILLAAGGAGYSDRLQDYLQKINEYYYWGAGGGFSMGTKGSGKGWSSFRRTFSADPNSKFDVVMVEYGYCKIERINEDEDFGLTSLFFSY